MEIKCNFKNKIMVYIILMFLCGKSILQESSIAYLSMKTCSQKNCTDT